MSILDITLGRNFWTSFWKKSFGRHIWTAFMLKPLEALLLGELYGTIDKRRTLRLIDSNNLGGNSVEIMDISQKKKFCFLNLWTTILFFTLTWVFTQKYMFTKFQAFLRPRAGHQYFLSLSWVITKTRQNYHPSTKKKGQKVLKLQISFDLNHWWNLLLHQICSCTTFHTIYNTNILYVNCHVKKIYFEQWFVNCVELISEQMW